MKRRKPPALPPQAERQPDYFDGTIFDQIQELERTLRSGTRLRIRYQPLDDPAGRVLVTEVFRRRRSEREWSRWHSEEGRIATLAELQGDSVAGTAP
ncbi:MAG TPA: hypothetical protein VF171_01980 [Trueperaceae bacterium]